MSATSTGQGSLQEDHRLDSEAPASSSVREPNPKQIELLNSRPRTSYYDTVHLIQSLQRLEEHRRMQATSMPDLDIISEDGEEGMWSSALPQSADILPDKSKWSTSPTAMQEERSTRHSPRGSQRGQMRKQSPCSSSSDSRSTSPTAMQEERSTRDSPRGSQKGNRRSLWETSSSNDSRSTSPMAQSSGRHHNSSQHQRTQFTEKVPNQQAPSPSHAASSSRQSSVASSVQRRQDAKPELAGGQVHSGVEALPPKVDRTMLTQIPPHRQTGREHRMRRATREEECERAARNMEEEAKRRKAKLASAPERSNQTSRKGARPKSSDREYLQQVVNAEPPTAPGVTRVDRNLFRSVPNNPGGGHRMPRATREEEYERSARNIEEVARLRHSKFSSAPQANRRGESPRQVVGADIGHGWGPSGTRHKKHKEGGRAGPAEDSFDEERRKVRALLFGSPPSSSANRSRPTDSREDLRTRAGRRGVEGFAPLNGRQQQNRIVSLDNIGALRMKAPNRNVSLSEPDLPVLLPGMLGGELQSNARRSGESRRRSLSKSSASSSSSSSESDIGSQQSAPELPRGRLARLRNRLGKFFQRREKPKFRSKAEEKLAQGKWEEVATDLVLIRAGLLPPGHLAY